jgi:hypothetical protein
LVSVNISEGYREAFFREVIGFLKKRTLVHEMIYPTS